MIDPHAAEKARILAEQPAEEPQDWRAAADLERWRELTALRNRGHSSPELVEELRALNDCINRRAAFQACARREAARQAEAEKRAEQQRAEVAAEQARVRPILRASFAGTDAEFEERWPQLWARYRDRQALDAAAADHDAALEAKRRQLGL